MTVTGRQPNKPAPKFLLNGILLCSAQWNLAKLGMEFGYRHITAHFLIYTRRPQSCLRQLQRSETSPKLSKLSAIAGADSVCAMKSMPKALRVAELSMRNS